MALARDCSVFGLNILQQAWIPVLLLSTRTQQNARGTGWEQTFKAPSAGKQWVLQGPCPPHPTSRPQPEHSCSATFFPSLLFSPTPAPTLPSPRDPQGRADPRWRNIIQYPPYYKRGPQKGGSLRQGLTQNSLGLRGEPRGLPTPCCPPSPHRAVQHSRRAAQV